MPIWREVRAVDWSNFQGAYRTAPDIAAALENLRWGNPDDDDFEDAYLDVLYGHVWHQGTIFPVTSKVLPFIFDLLDSSPALRGAGGSEAREALAQLFVCCAASARHAVESDDADERRAAVEVLATLAACEVRLVAWLATAERDQACATMLNVPTLAARLLAGQWLDRRDLLLAILTQTEWLDQTALAWAAAELSRMGHPVTDRASALLAEAASGAADERRDLGAERFEGLANAIASGELARAGARFGFAEKPAMDRPGETVAEVHLCDRDWFVARTERNVTLRWRAHPFVEGDRVVLVDINGHNLPREVRGTGDKAQHRATFGDRGSMIPPSG